MNRVLLPAAAVITFLANVSVVPCLAQSAGLPQTIWSKSVQTPGDNQYSNQGQSQRHAAPAPRRQVQQQAASPPARVWRATPRPWRADPSVEAIAADEPVPPQGFPPLPDRLELPVTLGYAGSSGSSSYGGGGGGRYGGRGGNGGGNVPGMASRTGGPGYTPPKPQGMHQNYEHYSPGAFMPPSAQPSSGGSSSQSTHNGYYKVQTPEQFSGGASSALAGSASDDGTPKYSGASAKDLRALGKEPKLGKGVATQSPEAPTPVVVNQSTTQDLSLVDDEFSDKKPTKKNGTARRATQLLRQAAGMGMGMGMGHL